MKLLIIDPQEDFCNSHTGTLYVPGAHADMQRIAELIRRSGPAIDQITVTLDMHHRPQIFHPCWWIDKYNNHPPPFTLIRHSDAASGIWRTTDSAQQAYSELYIKKLEQTGRYVLTIWPYHCLVGSTGASVYSPLFSALSEWEQLSMRAVTFWPKGENARTEHYSALRAEVHDPDDPQTSPNLNRIRTTLESGDTLIAGEALSHCLRYTVEDIVEIVGDDLCSSLTILRDATSSIPGFEDDSEDFLARMSSKGVNLRSVTDY